MAYTSFETLKEVAEKYKIEVKAEEFVYQIPFALNEYFKEQLEFNFKDRSSIISEASICEKLISPIINEVARKNNLTVFSHIQFDLKDSDILKGIPDYIVGIKSKYDAMSLWNPILCLAEAKKEDFTKGWAQVAAEMYAAYKTNENENKAVPVYGLVSTGKQWEFGILDNNILTIDTNTFSASTNLQEVFDVLNWVFCECRKNIDKILEIERQQGE